MLHAREGLRLCVADGSLLELSVEEEPDPSSESTIFGRLGRDGRRGRTPKV